MEKKIDCRSRKNPLGQITSTINTPGLTRIRVLTDNEEDADMISRFLGEKGFEVGVDTNGIEYWIEGGVGQEGPKGLPGHDQPAGPGPLILISKPYLGERGDELGKRLLREYIENLVHSDPGQLVLIHRGVEAGNPDCFESLLEKGWEILICRSSLRHYKLDSHRICGRVADMTEISRTLNRAERILSF